MHYANPRHARRCRNIMRGKHLRSQSLAALNAKAFWEKAPSSVAS